MVSSSRTKSDLQFVFSRGMGGMDGGMGKGGYGGGYGGGGMKGGILGERLRDDQRINF